MQLKKLITVQEGSDALNRYFTEIRSYEPLTKEEERDLIIIIQSKKPGCERAMDKLIKANLKFVVSVAKQYQGQGSNLMDLISEGNAGMCQAVYMFDTTRDLKFFSYAVWWIRLQMFKNLYNDNRTIRLPDNRALLVTRIKREVNDLEQKLQRMPSIDELVDHLDGEFNREELYEAILHGGQEKSINDANKVGGSTDDFCTIEDIIPGDATLQVDEIDRLDSLKKDLGGFYYNLAQKEFDVITFVLGLCGEKSLRSIDIAKLLGIKEKEVIKLKHRAIKRLKKLKGVSALKDYL